jgi:hypothetical protein
MQCVLLAAAVNSRLHEDVAKCPAFTALPLVLLLVPLLT